MREVAACGAGGKQHSVFLAFFQREDIQAPQR